MWPAPVRVITTSANPSPRCQPVDLAGIPSPWKVGTFHPACRRSLTIEGVRHVRPDWGRAADAAGRPPIWSRTPSAVAPDQDVEARR